MSTADIVKLIYKLPENQQWKVVMDVLQKLQQQNNDGKLAEPGTPMSMEVFKQRISKAEKDVLEGNVLSTQEVRNRLKAWK